jgi:gluconokinase
MAAEARGPLILVIMGVSGSGKSTIAAMLAQRLGWTCEDADRFHPRANVEKMHAGIALTDADRKPWLAAVAGRIDAMRAAGRHGVVACSALRRAYRDVLIDGRNDVRLVYLKGDPALIARRLATRLGHFMPSSLLGSQFELLEEPTPDEHPVVVSIAPHPHEIVEAIVAQLRPAVSANGGAAVARRARPS